MATPSRRRSGGRPAPCGPCPPRASVLRIAAPTTEALLLRAPRLSQLDLSAAAQLELQAAAFERAAPSGATPKLVAVLPITAMAPRGGLVVELVAGRAPSGPDDLPALARALAAIHSLPTPVDRPPIPSADNPLKTLADRAEATLETYMPKAGIGRPAAAAIADRLRWLKHLVANPPPMGPDVLCVTDSHPGNFLLRETGAAVFVDLEKPAYGCPALDLAHTVIDAAAGWDPDAGMRPDAAARDAFAAAWLAAVPSAVADANAPLIRPFRQAVWLRTISFFMRWQAESAVQGPWSADRLGPEAAQHFARHVRQSLTDDAVLAAASAWTE